MNRTLAIIGLAVLAVFALELFGLHLLKPFENRLVDAFVRNQAASATPDSDLVIVNIDEKSLFNMQKDAGRWPWPRSVHADLIDGLSAQKPRAIVFDIMFSEPDLQPQGDQALAQAAAKYRNVYFPMLRLDPRDDPRGDPIAEVAPLLGMMRGPNADPKARIAVVPPRALPPELWRTGTINFVEDYDGVGRRYTLRTRIAGWELPSLPARLAFDMGFPVPDTDDMVLAWRGKGGDFRQVSYSDLYEEFNRSKRTRPANEFTQKIVIIGSAAAGLQDLRVTPLGSLHPAVEILGTAIENLKNNRHMQVAPRWWAAAIGISLVFLLYLAFQRGLDARVTGIGLAALTAGLLFASYAAVKSLLLTPLLTPLVSAWTFYVAASLSEYLRERRARREAVALFSRFVNPEVVKQLIERGGIQGAGQQREVTLLFSDIRGFTSLSEKRRPEEVVTLLNRYFSLQVDVVFRHGGSLDKFIGDCIMALWGAPLDDREHARRAVACALDMADTLAVFKREFGEGAKDFDVGIGVHSGPAVVGLIGSEKRREYTAIGDTVNLASRIEGLTKDAKRRILVSRDTMERCADGFDFVSCGTFPVKGRAQPVELFEPRRKP